ncbi:SrmB Superfamily II DNA and RNA helicase [Pyrenophora tritici-repentis]|uniref:RNA helicase n=2 Tax=Pyrenophora tritici-repentis TaxID=45151 RepID=A0A2W1GIJ3_9PLEO|nr:ATP-dependent RNA helicase DBP5 [Pyrenophora tritici-repentis Pt-1C-BFP]KAA8621571.1 ATP-dependent RNA helicase DBP5 [Pyrenophora tritici-repentis]EDU43075.1 ATP-dependent RNA helicase DBP5 [Pyrenophora tritici-repentis Pt-1C-BFP]KAF7450812.1 ATP-dependent RNA helicase DBP5 [Pyrenophora tritici-repentis]KAF7573463.1 SrmB, Superfamily II DNA and RNA helicase [Pyrenophora tritici-repentis]KAG9380974.1 ATP-dependent RNA helicase DBP5 [Pyrenophora tritici-repentis]
MASTEETPIKQEAEAPAAEAPVEETPAQEPESSLETDQVDGAGAPAKGADLVDTPYKVEVKLADLQADPNNPLFSATSFEELKLSEALLKGVRNMNFRKPSKVQEKALPLLLMDPPQNMIAQSQSGTGKTAAFSLNILSRIDLSNPNPQALALAPSRELARQILGVITHMGQFMDGLTTMAAVPDPSRKGQAYNAQVLVGTPGTVQDMLRRRLINNKSIKILVLDEADNMLDQQGMGEQCTRVKALLNKDIQTVLFSATFPPNVIAYAKRFAPNANLITLAHDELTIEGIKQLYIDIDKDNDKYSTLLKFYGLMTQASSIIFVRTRRTAEELEKRMVAEGHKVAQLSGALEGPERDRIIDQFRSGEAKVLITTNVLARGIDVESVTMVINYDVPTMANGIDADPETYLHRIGRTGRFGRVGVALTFIHDKNSWQQLHNIASYYKTELYPIDTSDWDAVEDMIQKIIKSSRAGKSTEEMTEMITKGS